MCRAFSLWAWPRSGVAQCVVCCVLFGVSCQGCPFVFLVCVGGSNGVVLFDLWRSFLPWFSWFPFCGGGRASE